MATTTNYGWTTPDDTALVKDGASAIRTLGTSVDTTTKNLNPSTTLGDVEYRSSTANTNTRLGIGSTGQVLTVAAGVPSWATPATNANWSLLNAGGTALTAATTITVSGISGKDQIMVIVDSASSVNASAQYRITFNSDSGAKYSYFGINNSGQAAWSADNFGDLTAVADTKIQFGMQSAAAGGRINGYLLATGCNTAGVKMFNLATGANISGSNTQRQYVMGGLFNDTAVISSVSITSSSGNFDAGTIYVYTTA
jgi:hypothetical protein